MTKMIVIEGPDRTGKFTQSRLLKQYLVNKGFVVAAVEVPLKSNFVYHIIYWMLGNGLAKTFPKLFQWLQYFNRQIFQWMKLPELEKKYDYIIMDRWSLSTVVYGVATGVPESFTNSLYERLKKPDSTVILLGPSHKHEAEDVYESDSDLQRKVRELYSEWAIKKHDCCFVVDCSNKKHEVFEFILQGLKRSNIV